MNKPFTPALVLAACLLYAVPVPGHPGIAVQIRDLSSRITADHGNSELFLKRGELHRIHRDFQAARADYRKSRELNPELVLVDFCLGRMWLEAGRPGESRAALDRFLAAQPGNPEALAFRGRAKALEGEYREALGDFTAAITAYRGKTGNPPPELFIERARTQVTAGVEAAAVLRGLEEGLELLGQPVTLHLEALELEISSGRFRAALERLDRLAAVSVRQESWLARRGEILEAAGRDQEAASAYREALRAIVDLPDSRRHAGGIHRLQLRIQEGLERLSESASTGEIGHDDR